MSRPTSARYVLGATIVAALAASSACARKPPTAASSPCPGTYDVVRGACEAAPASECRGVCGQVVRRGGCTPVRNATIFGEGNAAPSASTDASGHFDLVGLPVGHQTLGISAGQEDARLEIDVVEGPQPLAFPLELTFLDRACGCGGACTNGG